MKIFLFAVLLIAATCCHGQQVRSGNTSKPVKCPPSVRERLRDYFDRSEMRPEVVLNNNGDWFDWKSERRAIKVGDHTVIWIVEATDKDWNTKLSIDGNEFPLNGKVDHGDASVSADDVNSWDQIKLFSFGDREVILVNMNSHFCTGLSCRVSVQLVYDVKSKTKTTFGSFSVDAGMNFYRLANDEPFYVAATFEGDPHGETSPGVVTYKLFKWTESGRLVKQSDPSGKPLFLKHTTFPDTAKPDTLVQKWIEQVD